MTQEEINISLFDEVQRLKQDLPAATERAEKAERDLSSVQRLVSMEGMDSAAAAVARELDAKDRQITDAEERAERAEKERDELRGALTQAQATLAKHDEVGAKNLGDFLTLTTELKVTREVSHLWARLFARCAIEYGLDVDLDLAADAELKDSLMEFRGNLPGLCAAAREHGWIPLPLPPKETT